ncbi:microtubule-associated protein 9-like isoform X2 [Macrobrachium rosenbergii]|uniref:microtubule-associated protein 9-like isoform X2 n=1 Tax=Macrobrachium rosenbergii TaxID=79674 RepID=UPI0034D6982B
MSSDSDDSFFGDDREESEKADSDEKQNKNDDDDSKDNVQCVDSEEAEGEGKNSDDGEEEKRESEGEEETNGSGSEEENVVEEEVYEEEEFDEDSEEEKKDDDDEFKEDERASDSDVAQPESGNEVDDENGSDENDNENEDENKENEAEGDEEGEKENAGKLEDVNEEEEEREEEESAGDKNEELENLFSNNSSSSASSSPSKQRRGGRPSSARNQMKVLITATRQRSLSPCSSEDSRKAVVFDTHDNSRASSAYYNLHPGSHPPSPSKYQPPPLLVTKSPVHSRPVSARRSRDNSPRSSCGEITDRGPSVGDAPETGTSKMPREGVPPPSGNRGETGSLGLSNTNNGINRVLSKKEQSSRGDVTSLKPRPKSAVTQPKIMGRGPSVPGNRIQLPRHRPLGDYSRSLQMLGVKVPPPAPKTPKTPRSSSSQSWQSEGKLHTRVTKRSTSLEDVTLAIPQVKEPETLRDLQVDEAQRATLSQAIYEEWYFRRCKQIRSRRIKAKRKVQEEQREKEAIFLSWKEQKIHEGKEKRRRLKEEEEERKRKEEEDFREKREVADLAYSHWKKKKLLEEGEKLQKVYVKSEMVAAEETRRRLHRSSEALNAYENWLDGIEEREVVRNYSNTRAVVLQTNRPPWWPGGTHNSLMGSC